MVCVAGSDTGLPDTHMASVYLAIIVFTWCAFVRLSESGQAAVIYTLVGSELPQQAVPATSSAVDSDTNSSSSGPVTIPLALSDAPPLVLNDSQYIVRAEPRLASTAAGTQEGEKEGLGTVVLEEQEETNDTLPRGYVVQDLPPTPQEDIPSFSEWAQKQLAEAEKKKGDNVTGGGGVGPVLLKARHNKNYASPDCGAKVVAANPEAVSSWAVLSSSRDEYLLNTCNARIWFIVELCEAILPKKIEIANFELFSSTPKEFSVSLSDRYPSRDWALAGRFTGQDERNVQAFNLSHTAHFGKYVKVEVHSHHGQEHYCPVSLFRVYGTSEIEVLDTVDEEVHHSAVDDDDDDLVMGEGGDVPKNLFGSARDAVLSIVKKAAEVLAKGPDERNSSRSVDSNVSITDYPCITPSHLVVCVNCSDDFYNKMYEVLSCRTEYLAQLLTSSFVQKTLVSSDLCGERGLDVRVGAPYPARPQPAGQPRPVDYLQAFLPLETLTALCNMLAVDQKKVVLNGSQDENLLDSNETTAQELATSALEAPTPVLPDHMTTPCLEDSHTSEETLATRSHYDTPVPTMPIRPSRTVPVEDVVEGEGDSSIPLEVVNATVTEPAVESSTTVVSDNSSNVILPVTDSVAVEDSGSLDSLFSELEQAVVPSVRVPPTVQKESVFVRLANRIKALERNMSLSSQYLEELSRRYKKQVEEMQRALAAAMEERRRGEEREGQRLEQLSQLTQQVDALTAAVKELLGERDSWQHKATVMGQHGIIVIVEVLVFSLVLYICRWLPNVEVSKRKFSLAWTRATGSVTRRKSVDEAVPLAVSHKRRRPSEEALVIAGSTHQELLIPEVRRKISKGETRRQRRKRKRELAVNSEDTAQKKPSLLDMNSTESVAGWWEEEVYSPVMATPPPPRPDVVVAAAPRFVQTAIAQRQDRIARSNSDVGEKENKKILPIKKAGPFKKIVKKFF